jgi:hypothetical protein
MANVPTKRVAPQRTLLPPGTFGRYPIGLATDLRMTGAAIRLVLLIEQTPPLTYRSQEDWAARIGINVRTFRRAVVVAVSCGYLEVIKGRLTGNGREADRYRVLYPPRTAHGDIGVLMEGASLPDNSGQTIRNYSADPSGHRSPPYQRLMKPDSMKSEDHSDNSTRMEAARAHGREATPSRAHDAERTAAMATDERLDCIAQWLARETGRSIFDVRRSMVDGWVRSILAHGYSRAVAVELLAEIAAAAQLADNREGRSAQHFIDLFVSETLRPGGPPAAAEPL